jgi:hypothetical protein
LCRYGPKNTNGFREREPKQLSKHYHRECIDPHEIRDKATHRRKADREKEIHEEIAGGVMSEIILEKYTLRTMRKKSNIPEEYEPEINGYHKK